MAKKDCPKCAGKGNFKGKDGTIQVCVSCLQEEDQHGTPKDQNVKI